MQMIYSNSGLALTKQSERCELNAYQDSRGIWTIGWGHTNGVKQGDVCTVAMAESWLRSDYQWATACVNHLVKVPLTQWEFDALVDFVFNVGSGNFRSSTMLILLNRSDYAGAAMEFDRWDECNGMVLAGLLHRRELETREFEGAD